MSSVLPPSNGSFIQSFRLFHSVLKTEITIELFFIILKLLEPFDTIVSVVFGFSILDFQADHKIVSYFETPTPFFVQGILKPQVLYSYLCYLTFKWVTEFIY